MKKTCVLLLLIVWAIYLQEGYKMITNDNPHRSALNGALSDIAEEVIAIPLETNTSCQLRNAREIKRDQGDLFLVSNRQLYHFDCSGKFINQITYNDNFQVLDYTIDPVNKQLVVVNDREVVHFYNYSGDLLDVKSLAGIHALDTSMRLSYYNHHIWVTAKTLAPSPEEPDKMVIQQWLFKFDTTLNPVDARKLEHADLGRFYLCCDFDQEIVVANENVYVHSSTSQPKELLRDTLYLISQNKLNIDEDYSSILPLRIGNRFLISTYHDAEDTKNSYTFCFDQKGNNSYNVAGGFDDNFYHTGKVPELQSMDVSSNSFCYLKSGEEIKKAFPDRKEGENPVLFILKMKEA